MIKLKHLIMVLVLVGLGLISTQHNYATPTRRSEMASAILDKIYMLQEELIFGEVATVLRFMIF